MPQRISLEYRVEHLLHAKVPTSNHETWLPPWSFRSSLWYPFIVTGFLLIRAMFSCGVLQVRLQRDAVQLHLLSGTPWKAPGVLSLPGGFAGQWHRGLAQRHCCSEAHSGINLRRWARMKSKIPSPSVFFGRGGFFQLSWQQLCNWRRWNVDCPDRIGLNLHQMQMSVLFC